MPEAEEGKYTLVNYVWLLNGKPLPPDIALKMEAMGNAIDALVETTGTAASPMTEEEYAEWLESLMLELGSYKRYLLSKLRQRGSRGVV